MLQQTYPELQKPVARLMELSADEIVRHQKDAWDRARRDEEARNRLAEARGRAEGKAEGEAKKSGEIALNLRGKGISVDIIAETTGLTPDEIVALPKV
jgi:predicted transposase YdaD